MVIIIIILARHDIKSCICIPHDDHMHFPFPDPPSVDQYSDDYSNAEK